MNKQIVINSSLQQTRIAFLDNNKLVDFFIEQPEDTKLVGNIYLGKVVKIFPGINAAFVNIGQKNDAFLHFSDIARQTDEFSRLVDDYSDLDEFDDDDEIDNIPSRNNLAGRNIQTDNSAPHLVKNQEILVQIIKEPISNKGARITTGISIPGRFCVLLPYNKRIGVSRKISDRIERKRLRTIARNILPKDCGLIIRTNAKDQHEDSLSDDLKTLIKIWQNLQKKAKNETAPSLLYKDFDTTISLIRDFFNADINKIVIDSKSVYKEIRDYIDLVQPEQTQKVEYYKDSVPIFEKYSVEQQVKKYLGRKVPLPSGGYLIIEHTEAMTVVDVNSGTFVHNKEQEQNSFKIDIDAAREIARQLRLRDIGGLIVCDFIDLKEETNRVAVFEELKEAFRTDRAKVHILPMTEFALIQMTRQRVRSSYMQMTSEICECCGGTGILTQKTSFLHELEQTLHKIKQNTNYKSVIVKVHPYFAEKLNTGGFFSIIFKLQFKLFMRIRLELDEKLRPGNYKVIAKKDLEDLTKEFK